MAAICSTTVGTAMASVAPPDPAPASTSAKISVSGTVLDARSARDTADGLVTAPTSTPAVAGARVEVNGTLVARTDGKGAFKFAYPAPSGQAVTVTVTAPGFGDYRLGGITPASSGDTLNVQLTGREQSFNEQGAAAPATFKAAAAPAALTADRCGDYSSDTTPPSTIRVLQYAQHTPEGWAVPGTQMGIYNVPFQEYVQSVLPKEWISSWHPDSLKAGAMAAKTYSWYWVNHWRGQSYNGTCYNVDDSIGYQRYVPGQSEAPTNAAVAATWNSVMTRNGAIFEASFQRTLTNNTAEACGTGLDRYPNTLSQWGSQNCALAGRSWQSILGTYYPGVSVTTAGSGATSSPVSMDAAGDHVAFVDTNGNVANDWADANGWHGPAGLGGQARSDSPVVLSPAGDHAFFIDPNGNLVNDWADANGWHGAVGIGGKARAGSPIAVSPGGNLVAFVDTNGNVANVWADSNGWHGPAGLGGQARSDSPLAFNAAGDHVFFIDPSGAVVNDWADGNGWHGPVGIGGTAKAGSSIASAGNLVAFVDTNGNLANDWADSNGWHGPAGTGGQPRSDSPLVFNKAANRIYFIDGNGAVANDWADSNGWHGPAGIGGYARAGSGLATNASGDHVVFVDGNGAVANDWADSNGWHGPAGLGGTSR